MLKLQIVLVPPRALEFQNVNTVPINSTPNNSMILLNNANKRRRFHLFNNMSFNNFNNSNVNNPNASNTINTSVTNRRQPLRDLVKNLKIRMNQLTLMKKQHFQKNCKKFLLFIGVNQNLNDLADEVMVKFCNMYPSLTDIQIITLQDKNGNDLDPDFNIKDVFNTDNIVHVLINRDVDWDDQPKVSQYSKLKKRKLNPTHKKSKNESFSRKRLSQQQDKYKVKKSTTSSAPKDVPSNTTLRIHTPLMNGISRDIDSIIMDQSMDRSILLPPSKPQAPTIRISSGVDHSRKISNGQLDSVSRSEIVDPDKSKQQIQHPRIDQAEQSSPKGTLLGTPVMSVVTPNKMTLSEQKQYSNSIHQDNMNTVIHRSPVKEASISNIPSSMKTPRNDADISTRLEANVLDSVKSNENLSQITDKNNITRDGKISNNITKVFSFERPSALSKAKKASLQRQQSTIANDKGSPVKNGPLNEEMTENVHLAELPAKGTHYIPSVHRGKDDDSKSNKSKSILEKIMEQQIVHENVLHDKKADEKTKESKTRSIINNNNYKPEVKTTKVESEKNPFPDFKKKSGYEISPNSYLQKLMNNSINQIDKKLKDDSNSFTKPKDNDDSSSSTTSLNQDEIPLKFRLRRSSQSGSPIIELPQRNPRADSRSPKPNVQESIPEVSNEKSNKDIKSTSDSLTKSTVKLMPADNKAETVLSGNSSFRKIDLLQMFENNSLGHPPWLPKEQRSTASRVVGKPRRKPYITVLNKDIDNSRPDPRNILPSRTPRNAAQKATMKLSGHGEEIPTNNDNDAGMNDSEEFDSWSDDEEPSDESSSSGIITDISSDEDNIILPTKTVASDVVIKPKLNETIIKYTLIDNTEATNQNKVLEQKRQITSNVNKGEYPVPQNQIESPHLAGDSPPDDSEIHGPYDVTELFPLSSQVSEPDRSAESQNNDLVANVTKVIDPMIDIPHYSQINEEKTIETIIVSDTSDIELTDNKNSNEIRPTVSRKIPRKINQTVTHRKRTFTKNGKRFLKRNSKDPGFMEHFNHPHVGDDIPIDLESSFSSEVQSSSEDSQSDDKDGDDGEDGNDISITNIEVIKAAPDAPQNTSSIHLSKPSPNVPKETSRASPSMLYPIEQDLSSRKTSRGLEAVTNSSKYRSSIIQNVTSVEYSVPILGQISPNNSSVSNVNGDIEAITPNSSDYESGNIKLHE